MRSQKTTYYEQLYIKKTGQSKKKTGQSRINVCIAQNIKPIKTEIMRKERI